MPRKKKEAAAEVVAEQVQAQEPQAAETEAKESKATLWMNRVPNDWFAKDKETGERRVIEGKFGQSYQLNLQDEQGRFSALVPANRVMPEKNKDGIERVNSSRIRGYEGMPVSISRQAKDAEGKFVKGEDGKNVYEHSTMTFDDLKAGYDARQKDFYAKQRAADKAKDLPEGPAAPEAEAQAGE